MILYFFISHMIRKLIVLTKILFKYKTLKTIMLTIDLVIGYNNELLSQYLYDQYIQNEKEQITLNLYNNTKINKDLINIIVNYSLSNIVILDWSSEQYLNVIDNYLNKMDKLIMCFKCLNELTSNAIIRYNIANIFMYKYLLVINDGLFKNRKYSKHSIIKQNIDSLKYKFNILFKPRGNNEIKFNKDLIYYHFRV